MKENEKLHQVHIVHLHSPQYALNTNSFLGNDVFHHFCGNLIHFAVAFTLVLPVSVINVCNPLSLFYLLLFYKVTTIRICVLSTISLLGAFHQNIFQNMEKLLLQSIFILSKLNKSEFFVDYFVPLSMKDPIFLEMNSDLRNIPLL